MAVDIGAKAAPVISYSLRGCHLTVGQDKLKKYPPPPLPLYKEPNEAMCASICHIGLLEDSVSVPNDLWPPPPDHCFELCWQMAENQFPLENFTAAFLKDYGSFMNIGCLLPWSDTKNTSYSP